MKSIRQSLSNAARGVLLLLLAAALAISPAGCSLFVDPDAQVTLEASDPAARLFVDGREVGTGTATVQLRRNDSHAVRAETADGRIAQGRIRKQISTTGILDIIGGLLFLVPFIGAAAPGFWDLDPDYLFLKITPAQDSETRPS